MGACYRAYDRRGRRVVQIHRVPLPEGLRNDEARARIAAAAATLEMLKHPLLAVPLDVVFDGGGLWIVSPHIEGTALDQRLKTGAAWAPADASRLVADLAAALLVAHESGVVHGDITPSAIFLDTSNRPHLAGFGWPALAALAGREGLASGVLASGTVGYLAPELLGAGADAFDPRRDVYALGVVLYELLTGRRPFEGTVLVIVKQITTTDPRRPGARKRGIPRDLDAICLKALERDPAARYASAAALAEALQTFLGAGASSPERRRGFWK
jgi:serine/threonine protein kinase